MHTGARGAVNDAIAVYVSNPVCAAAFVAPRCVPGDLPSFYDLRQKEPAQRVPTPCHKTPSFG
jgi:hypothetical protein